MTLGVDLLKPDEDKRKGGDTNVCKNKCTCSCFCAFRYAFRKMEACAHSLWLPGSAARLVEMPCRVLFAVLRFFTASCNSSIHCLHLAISSLTMSFWQSTLERFTVNQYVLSLVSCSPSSWKVRKYNKHMHHSNPKAYYFKC